MIKYILKCKNGHEFESWFSDSGEFEKLRKSKLLDCIFCNSRKIEKSIMSPRIISSKQSKKLKNTYVKEFNKTKKDLIKIRKFIERNFNYVGDQFSRKIREVFYNNKKSGNIYGTVTREEKKELKEEGIKLINIPWIDKNN
tara:strand:- start:85 stop:507 length:423 start_codon:yes stop_codon:yes gene_type:complete